MGRKLSALCLLLAAAIGFALPAAAQFGCPPGQTFIPTLNRCIAVGEGQRCPPGTQYDSGQRRCIGTPQGTENEGPCPPGQQFDAPQNRCVASAPAAGGAPVTR
jgi:hypothetical protein